MQSKPPIGCAPNISVVTAGPRYLHRWLVAEPGFDVTQSGQLTASVIRSQRRPANGNAPALRHYCSRRHHLVCRIRLAAERAWALRSEDQTIPDLADSFGRRCSAEYDADTDQHHLVLACSAVNGIALVEIKNSGRLQPR